MAKGSATINISEIPPREVLDALQRNEGELAKRIEDRAKSSTAFNDITGRLRKSIRAERTDYGWRVKAGGRGAKQAFNVEHGHGGPSPASAKAFLLPAQEEVAGENGARSK